MFVRLTYIYFLPGQAEAAKKIFNEEIIPVVKQQKGNESIMLLEPTDTSGEFISLTIWKSSIDAQGYESSGIYKELVNKASHTFSKAAVLKSYNEV